MDTPKAKENNVPKNKKFKAEKFAPYLFVLPFLLSFLIFSAYPFVSAIRMSFQEVFSFDNTQFIGIDNYKRVFNDPLFFKSLWNVLRYTFWTLVILIPIPMAVAFIMNRKGTPLKNLFRSIFFLPVLTSSVVAGVVFKYAFSNEATGVFNKIVTFFGGEPVRWLEKAGPAMFALVIIAIWRWMGTNMIYFLSGLQGISPELYESADVDGATAWQKFTKITVPLLKPITIYVLTISIMGGFSLFNESYVYWDKQSPNGIGSTLVIMIYKAAFVDGNFGYACAIGVVMFLIVVIINFAQTHFMGLFKEDR